MEAGSGNNYVPEDEAVLAATGVAAPGESVEGTVTAPEETGDSRYICTFPGHWPTLQDTMTVTSSAAA